MKAIRETVRYVRAQFKNDLTRLRRQQVQRPLTVVLDGALAAATNALTSPGTAVASVLKRLPSGDLEDTGDNIDIVNRYENVSLVAETIGVATWMDGEWRMTSADCDALGAWVPVEEVEAP